MRVFAVAAHNYTCTRKQFITWYARLLRLKNGPFSQKAKTYLMRLKTMQFHHSFFKKYFV